MHRYWSVMENRRVIGGRSVLKPLPNLGETNERDRSAGIQKKTDSLL